MRCSFSLAALLACVVLICCAQKADAVCGYKGCPVTKANLINVHLIPHSHDDVGWLKTVDQYYYGSQSGIQHAGVQYILDNVIQALLKDPKRRFIYVESAFFFKWYNEQTATMKTNVKRLVTDGRLEFAGGAWSMNDEAAVHYQSVIDQFTVGLKALSDTFGVCARPRIGWQIDPFGHSREMTSIFAQMGYDGEFFSRMDWVEKNLRLTNLTAEMIWKASESLGERSELFTGLLYNHYSAPPGFCFDALCKDAPIIDGDSYDNNVNERVNAFIEYIEKVTKSYRSSHVIQTMGGDFNYENAEMNFKNMDKLIKYVNERQARGSKINLLYSTPACYLNSLHETTSITWPNKAQDFFPFSTDFHTYWTGYYSSRPTQKRFERDGNHFLQVAKQLTVIANLTGTDVNNRLDNLRHIMGVIQHHDAITGTEKQHVASDYDRLLAAAIVSASSNTRAALQKLSNLTTGEFTSCLQLNISMCEFTRNGGNGVVVTLYNPLAHSSTQFVRVPVKNEIYEVKNEAGRVISSQLIAVPWQVLSLPFRDNFTQHELVFEAFVEKVAHYYIVTKPRARAVEEPQQQLNEVFKRHVPKLFHLQPEMQLEEEINEMNKEINPRADTIVQNSKVKLTFGSTGHLINVQMNGINENIRQDFHYYKGAYGNNTEPKNRSSGAYIFRPNGTDVTVNAQRVTLKIYEGTLVKEVHQHFNEWISQVIRIYENVNRVEFEWLVGPIPIVDGIGKEVITRFTSSINNKGVFWTDSNGREMLRRVKNEREYFKPNLTEDVAGNYYPITARIVLANEQKRLALLNDRAQGGSSLRNGEMELMLHRRLLHDDNFGVNEPLNETAYGKGLIARGKVYLILSPVTQKLSLYERMAQQQIHLPFAKFFSLANKATKKVLPKIPNFSSLPLSVQVLTLEPWNINERLLRLESYMDRNETGLVTGMVTFNIRTIFDSLGGEEIRETTLDGSMRLSDMKRFKFQPDGSKVTKVEYYTTKHTPLTAVKRDAVAKFNVSLEPMQIRTFIIKWK